MSCTENETGSFVVFFLPTLVGCLMILLARRWANSQVSNTSSTAVSRRRKIIKDPLIKRPLPTITCKMMPPGPKKATGVTKKVTLPLPEDESNGKRVSRTRLSATTPVAEVKTTEVPIHPKHVPFPAIPHDGSLLFESMTFVFVMMATGLQFLNLYRTAWWLPHTYTTQIMNYYLIDIHLVVFIVTLISRRFLLCAAQEALKAFVSPKLLQHALSATKLLIMGMVCSVLMFCTYVMLYKHPVIKIFFLCYPAVIYLFLFGMSANSLIELSQSAPPLHCCSSDPEQVRAEVDTLRNDFNLRVKKMLFNSILEAYYSSFIPCCFAQSYLYYDVYAASQQIAFVWSGLFARYSAQLLGAAVCDPSHRAALHLGRWDAAPHHAEEPASWCVSSVYGEGSAVSHAGAVFVARGRSVCATPGNNTHLRFNMLFYNPSTLLCCNLCTQLALIVLELCLLFSSMAWHNFLAIVVLLFINYYTLFKMMRDYLIAVKVYKAESMIQEKNTLATN